MEQSEQTISEQKTELVIGSGTRLTIETVAGFVQHIRRGLDEAATVVIEFDPEVEMDLTGLQVLCSACKTATAEGKRLMHRGALPRVLLDLVVEAGADHHGYCGNTNSSCACWFGGMENG